MLNTSAPKPAANKTSARQPARPTSTNLSASALQALLQPQAIAVMPNVGLVRVIGQESTLVAGQAITLWRFKAAIFL